MGKDPAASEVAHVGLSVIISDLCNLGQHHPLSATPQMLPFACESQQVAGH